MRSILSIVYKYWTSNLQQIGYTAFIVFGYIKASLLFPTLSYLKFLNFQYKMTYAQLQLYQIWFLL